MKVIYYFIALLYSNMTFSCIVSTIGAEYDALIVIEKLEEPNHYRVEIPKHINMHSNVEILLNYSIDGQGLSTDSPDSILIFNNVYKHEKIKTTVQGDKLIGEFVVQQNYKEPRIVVTWWSWIGCPVIAQVDVLVVE